MGYHIRDIPKGELGEISKIEEELEELKDAIEQGNKILALCELADIYGAICFYLEQHFNDYNMEDLRKMNEANARAFQDGSRR